ncbi:hypothetical protein D1BOALGB6SA_1346 [Olavius sp. associated proteobacterium Delta 1]|nr:hypothetical protein D1BOALGB6SA_1346 [Olavius sp. associated proteobacterium Delta 1]
MGILEEAAWLVEQFLGDDIKSITVERVVVGLFFTGIKQSNGPWWVIEQDHETLKGAELDHFFDQSAIRVVMEKL